MISDMLVSIVMPTYNTSVEYLEAAIDSILNQTWKNLEFIIINDGSTNQHKEFLEAQALRDSRIRLVHNDGNKGLVFSLNRGLDLSRGDYIMRMDADDIAERTRVARMVRYMQMHREVDILGGQYRRLIDGRLSIFKTHIPLTDGAIKTVLLYTSAFCHPSVCFRKTSIVKHHIAYSSNEKAEDYYLWSQCALAGCRFANLRASVLRYRLHGSQLTSTASSALENSGMSISRALLAKLGIQLSDDEFDSYHAFLHSRCSSVNEIVTAETVILKLISELPSSYTDQGIAKNTFARKYFIECMKCCRKGVPGVTEVFRNSSLGTALQPRIGYMILLRLIEIISKGRER